MGGLYRSENAPLSEQPRETLRAEDDGGIPRIASKHLASIAVSALLAGSL